MKTQEKEVNKMKYFFVMLILTWANVANAGGIAQGMQDFWDGMGGMSNFNGVDAYQLQSAGYYTMGGLYARTPVRNTQLASIGLPGLKGGCGGINLYNGGFSFINSEELTKLLQSISTNSSAFAMQLALETISPVIAEKVEELQSWVQRINSMNINSCETAASLVGGVWPRHEQASKTICSTLASGNGIASDYTRARHDCHASRGGMSAKIRSKDSDSADKLLTEDINIAWKALRGSGFFKLSGDANDDKELAELFMTLSGTIIIHAPNNQNDTPKFEYIAGKATHSDLITILLDGGTIPYHTCNETTKCLNVSRNGGSHSITQDQAFKAKVEKIIFALIDKIKTDSPLTDEEKSFLNAKAGVPLYKILNVYAAYSGSGAIFELPAYSEAIALQMLFEYLDDVLRQVDTAADSLLIAGEDHIKRFKDDIREARRTLVQREQKTHQNYATLMSLVDRAMMVEGILAKNIGSPLADAFHWSKNM